LAVSETAVQSVATAVFYMAVIGGFKNRGVVPYNRASLYGGCLRFQKPRCSQ